MLVFILVAPDWEVDAFSEFFIFLAFKEPIGMEVVLMQTLIVIFYLYHFSCYL